MRRYAMKMDHCCKLFPMLVKIYIFKSEIKRVKHAVVQPSECSMFHTTSHKSDAHYTAVNDM